MTVGQMANMYSSYRNLGINNYGVNKSLSKLSSGYRVNTAADDAAALSISEKMRGQISGLGMATQNATNAVSMVQTAEGGLDSSSSMLNRMRELAVQASNGTYSDDDRAMLNKEFQALKSEIDRVSQSTHYNGMKLLDGGVGDMTGAKGLEHLGISGITATDGGVSAFQGNAAFDISTTDGVTSVTATIGDQKVTQQIRAGDTGATFDFGDGNELAISFDAGALKDGALYNVGVDGNSVSYANTTGTVSGSERSYNFQIGANGGADQRVNLGIGDMSSAGLGVAGLDISTLDGANSAISALDKAVNSVSSERAGLGAMQNRLEHSINSLSVSKENANAAESTLRDLDMAKEMMNYTQKNIMRQASMAMMAQGMNLSRNNMLGLLMR